MTRWLSGVRIDALLAMLATFGLGLGLAPVLGVGAASPSDAGPGVTSSSDRGVAAASPSGASPVAGIDLTRHTNVIVPGHSNSRGSLDVSCSDGIVIGGGFSAGRNLRVLESRPHGIRTWRISWIQTSADATVAYAYAVCMNGGLDSRRGGSSIEPV